MVFTVCSHDKFVCPKISQVTGGSSKNGHEQLDGDYRYDHGHRTNPSCLRGLYASLRLEFVGRSLSVLKLWNLLLYMVCIGWFGGFLLLRNTNPSKLLRKFFRFLLRSTCGAAAPFFLADVHTSQNYLSPDFRCTWCSWGLGWGEEGR